MLPLAMLAGSARAQTALYDPTVVHEVRLSFSEPRWRQILDSLFVAGSDERLIADAQRDLAPGGFAAGRVAVAGEHHVDAGLGRAELAGVQQGARERVVGLGNLARVVETLASRPQLQERLTEQVADAIDAGLNPLGVLVVLEAAHGCVNSRGPRQTRSTTVTLATRGALTDPAARAAAISFIGEN